MSATVEKSPSILDDDDDDDDIDAIVDVIRFCEHWLYVGLRVDSPFPVCSQEQLCQIKKGERCQRCNLPRFSIFVASM